MRADLANARNHGVTQAGALLIGVELRLIGGHAGEFERVHAGHLRVHLLEGAGLDERMDAFAGADLEMIVTVRANLAVVVQFLVEDHLRALVALDPEALGDFLLARAAGAHLGLLGQGPFGGGGRGRRGDRRRDRILGGFEGDRLLDEMRRAHVRGVLAGGGKVARNGFASRPHYFFVAGGRGLRLRSHQPPDPW